MDSVLDIHHAECQEQFFNSIYELINDNQKIQCIWLIYNPILFLLSLEGPDWLLWYKFSISNEIIFVLIV